MNRMITVFILVFCAGIADAQTRRTLKDIDRELKQTKSTTTAMELISAIGEAEPQTDEDVRIMGQMMERYPLEGQKAAMRIKDPKLAKTVIQECDRHVTKFKADKDKDWKNLPEEQRQERINALGNAQAMMMVLGNLKNREALPYLKQYISAEYDGTLSYTASQAIGRIAPDDPLVFKELWEKPGVRNINYGAYGKSVLKETALKMQDFNIPVIEKGKLLAKAKVALLSGKDPEEKRLLKDILLNHPNEDLRKEAGIAMLHSFRYNKDPDDVDFILKWAGNVKDAGAGWSLYYVRDNFDNRFTPVLLKYLESGTYGSDRSNAAKVLGQHKVKGALPALEECVAKDINANVRGSCCHAYWEITGKVTANLNPDDVAEQKARFIDPETIKFYDKLSDTHHSKRFYLALKRAVEEYERQHR